MTRAQHGTALAPEFRNTNARRTAKEGRRLHKPCCPPRLSESREHAATTMVKEGADSTIRPKVTTYEFDRGKLFLDAWAADGKPMPSQHRLAVYRVLGVVTLTSAAIALVLTDWGQLTNGREHCFTPVQKFAFAWWNRFIEMDEADVAKAMELKAWRQAKQQEGAPSSDSWFASERARQQFFAAATAGKAGDGKK